jgi:hypothetical protein
MNDIFSQKKNKIDSEIIPANVVRYQYLQVFLVDKGDENKPISAFTEHNYSTPQVSRMFINESILPILK